VPSIMTTSAVQNEIAEIMAINITQITNSSSNEIP